MEPKQPKPFLNQEKEVKSSGLNNAGDVLLSSLPGVDAESEVIKIKTMIMGENEQTRTVYIEYVEFMTVGDFKNKVLSQFPSSTPLKDLRIATAGRTVREPDSTLLEDVWKMDSIIGVTCRHRDSKPPQTTDGAPKSAGIQSEIGAANEKKNVSCTFGSNQSMPIDSSDLNELVGSLVSEVKELKTEVKHLRLVLQKVTHCTSCIRFLHTKSEQPKSSKETFISDDTSSFRVGNDGPVRCTSFPTDMTVGNKPSVGASMQDIDGSIASNLNDSSPDNHPPSSELSSCSAEEERLRVAPQKHILVGAASFEVYVDEEKMISNVRKLKCPKLYACKLMELVFTREECKRGSLSGEGKDSNGNPLQKLDENRINAIHSEIQMRFPKDYNWKEIKNSMNTKCRQIRFGRIKTWKGEE